MILTNFLLLNLLRIWLRQSHTADLNINELDSRWAKLIEGEGITRLFLHSQVQHQDVLSHQHVLDSLSDRAPSLGQTPKTTRQLNDLHTHYSAVCQQSQELLTGFERQVSEHQQYQDAMQECREMIDALSSRLQLCVDCTGDKFSVQNKLDRAKVNKLGGVGL